MKKSRSEKIVIVPRMTRRDVFIAALVSVLALGFIAWGMAALWKSAPHNTRIGIIAAKHFTPQPEEQITVGKNGLDARKLDGEYTFEVRTESDGKTYTVWVDKRDYDARKIGDKFQFFVAPNDAR